MPKPVGSATGSPGRRCSTQSRSFSLLHRGREHPSRTPIEERGVSMPQAWCALRPELESTISPRISCGGPDSARGERRNGAAPAGGRHAGARCSSTNPRRPTASVPTVETAHLWREAERSLRNEVHAPAPHMPAAHREQLQRSMQQQRTDLYRDHHGSGRRRMSARTVRAHAGRRERSASSAPPPLAHTPPKAFHDDPPPPTKCANSPLRSRERGTRAAGATPSEGGVAPTVARWGQATRPRSSRSGAQRLCRRRHYRRGPGVPRPQARARRRL